MTNKLPNQDLKLMFYSNSNALAGNGTWFGVGGYTGAYRLQNDSLSEKISDGVKTISKGVMKIIKPTAIFSFYKVFSSPMPTI